MVETILIGVISWLILMLGVIIGIVMTDKEWHKAVKVTLKPKEKRRFIKKGWKFNE